MWDKLPLAWKLKCKPPPSDRLKVDQWKKDTIKIPKLVLDQLAVWEDDPLSILTMTTIPDEPRKDFAGRLYLALDNIRIQSQIMDAIRSRVLQIMLYLLMAKLGARQLRTNSEPEAEFHERINVGGGDETLKKIKAWATSGGKLYSLSLEFAQRTECLGSMICMPEDIKQYK